MMMNEKNNQQRRQRRVGNVSANNPNSFQEQNKSTSFRGTRGGLAQSSGRGKATQGSQGRRENLSADNKASLLTTGHAHGRGSNQADQSSAGVEPGRASQNTGPTLTTFQQQSQALVQSQHRQGNGQGSGGNWRTQQHSRQNSSIRAADFAGNSANSGVSITHQQSFNQGRGDGGLHASSANNSHSQIVPGQPVVIVQSSGTGGLTQSMLTRLKESIGRGGSQGDRYISDSRSKVQNHVPSMSQGTKLSEISEQQALMPHHVKVRLANSGGSGTGLGIAHSNQASAQYFQGAASEQASMQRAEPGKRNQVQTATLSDAPARAAPNKNSNPYQAKQRGGVGTAQPEATRAKAPAQQSKVLKSSQFSTVRGSQTFQSGKLLADDAAQAPAASKKRVVTKISGKEKQARYQEGLTIDQETVPKQPKLTLQRQANPAFQTVSQGPPSANAGSKKAAKLSSQQQAQLLMHLADQNGSDRAALAAQLGLLITTSQEQQPKTNGLNLHKAAQKTNPKKQQSRQPSANQRSGLVVTESYRAKSSTNLAPAQKKAQVQPVAGPVQPQAKGAKSMNSTQAKLAKQVRHGPADKVPGQQPPSQHVGQIQYAQLTRKTAVGHKGMKEVVQAQRKVHTTNTRTPANLSGQHSAIGSGSANSCVSSPDARLTYATGAAGTMDREQQSRSFQGVAMNNRGARNGLVGQEKPLTSSVAGHSFNDYQRSGGDSIAQAAGVSAKVNYSTFQNIGISQQQKKKQGICQQSTITSSKTATTGQGGQSQKSGNPLTSTYQTSQQQVYAGAGAAKKEKPGHHKRSISLKSGDQLKPKASPRLQSSIVADVTDGAGVVQKVKFNFNQSSLRSSINSKQSLRQNIAPLRTKQPSKANSRKPSKDKRAQDPATSQYVQLHLSKVLENAAYPAAKKSMGMKAHSSRGQPKGQSKNVKVNNLVVPERNFQLLKNFLSSMRSGPDERTQEASHESLPQGRRPKTSKNQAALPVFDTNQLLSDEIGDREGQSSTSTFKPQQDHAKTMGGAFHRRGAEMVSYDTGVVSGTFVATTDAREQAMQKPRHPSQPRSRAEAHQMGRTLDNQTTLKRGDDPPSQPGVQPPVPAHSDRNGSQPQPHRQQQEETEQSHNLISDALVDEYLEQQKQQKVAGSNSTAPFKVKKPKQPGNQAIPGLSPETGGAVRGWATAAGGKQVNDFQVNFHPQKQPPQSTSPMPEAQEESPDESSAVEGDARREQQHDLLDDQIQQKMLSQEQNAAAEKELKGQLIETSSAEYYSSQVDTTERTDPLLEDKQYIVTMIVNQFNELGQPVVTTPDFYRVGNKLGQGAFGKVSIAQHKLTGHFVAVKSLPKRDLDKEVECKRRVSQEMQILQHLTSHRNVVKLYDSFETTSHLCFVMELCAGGDLLSYVRRRKKLDEALAKYLFKQAAKSLAYCHKNLVLHRDIKLENLLIDEEGSIKLCDFGVSRQLKEPEELLSEQCGTPAYMAPEVHRAVGRIKGQPADVWSLGVCLYAMLVGMVPFRGKSIEELQQLIMKGEWEFPASADGLSKHAKSLVQGMLTKDPDSRMDITQVVKHPWLRGCPKKLKIFSQTELKKIKVLSQPTNGGDEPQRLLTEVALTVDDKHLSSESPTKEPQEHLEDIHLIPQNSRNIETKSVILAPFNTTVSNKEFERDIQVEPTSILKFNDKAREANRQYEFNYNEEVDNGVMISQSDENEVKNSLDAQIKSLSKDESPQGQQPIRKQEETKQPPKQKQQKLDPLESSDSYEQELRELDKINAEAKALLARPKAPMVSEISTEGHQRSPMLDLNNKLQLVSLASEVGEDKSRNTQRSVPEEQNDGEEVAIRPVINFNLGGLDLQFNPGAGDPEKLEKNSVSNTQVERIETVSDQPCSSSEDAGEEAVDMLIVCKIENEFGYPEQYITSCLKKGIKNDATTCYYLFLKEDKHEIVNLLSESPAQPLHPANETPQRWLPSSQI